MKKNNVKFFTVFALLIAFVLIVTLVLKPDFVYFNSRNPANNNSSYDDSEDDGNDDSGDGYESEDDGYHDSNGSNDQGSENGNSP